MIESEFEVFDSGGSWALLLGKPLLRLFQAKQLYWPDTVSIRDENNKKEMLSNQIKMVKAGDKAGINLILDVKQHDIVIGGSSETKPPPREVLTNNLHNHVETHTNTTVHPVYVTSNGTPKTEPESILTRDSSPNNPERVKRIIQEVTIGPDITQEERVIVQELLREYVDCLRCQ